MEVFIFGETIQHILQNLYHYQNNNTTPIFIALYLKIFHLLEVDIIFVREIKFPLRIFNFRQEY